MIENGHIYMQKKHKSVFFECKSTSQKEQLQSIIGHQWSMIENCHIYTKKTEIFTCKSTPATKKSFQTPSHHRTLVIWIENSQISKLIH